METPMVVEAGKTVVAAETAVVLTVKTAATSRTTEMAEAT
jgi:hypothetical protein